MTERMIYVDAIVKVLVAIFFSILLPIIKGWLERNRDNREIQQVLALARIAVTSVADDLKTAEGHIKKEEALARLAEQVQGWGLKDFSIKELDHYIGTAYKEMKAATPQEPVQIIVDNPEILPDHPEDAIIQTNN